MRRRQDASITAGQSAAPGGARPVRAAALSGESVGGLLLGLFVAALVLPVFFHLGDLRLSPVRVLLLATIVPLALRLLQGQAGPLRAADAFIGLHCLWIAAAIVTVEGAARIPFAGITAVELGGGYLVGRVLVRSRADFRLLLMAFLGSLAFLLPFAVLEFLTDRQLLQDAAGLVASTFEKPESSRPRLGFHRTMAGFEHPILFGLYCSVAVAHLLYLWQWSPVRRLVLVAMVTALTFLSLSAAPLLAVAFQVGLWAWDRLSGGRWGLLGLLVVLGYVTVDLLSNRTPLTVLISYLTFSEETGYTRILIWEYGKAAALANPLFGIGLGDWPRPFWLTESVDNFWLLTAMRYGLPALAFLLAGIVAGAWAILRARGLDAEVASYRSGYLVSLGAILLTLGTVHIWGAVSVFVMMWLGAGLWFADAQPDTRPETRQETAPKTGPQAAGRTPYTRQAEALRRGGRPAPAKPAAPPAPDDDTDKAPPASTKRAPAALRRAPQPEPGPRR